MRGSAHPPGGKLSACPRTSNFGLLISSSSTPSARRNTFTSSPSFRLKLANRKALNTSSGFVWEITMASFIPTVLPLLD